MSAQPDYRSIRLGAELRTWRTEHDRTLTEATEGLRGWNAGRLSKVERGLMPVNANDLTAFLDHNGVAGQDREDLLDLVREGPSRQWWLDHDFADTISPAFAEYLAMEADASHMVEYFPSAFPGLLQTPDYAREMIEAGIGSLSEEQLEAAAEVRVLRQRRLTEPPVLEVEGYFGEVALLIAADQKVLADQIRHAIKVAQYPNVTLSMVPLSAGRPGILNSGVTLLGFADEPGEENGFVFVEAVGGMLPRRSGRDVRRTRRTFDRLRRHALSPDDTLTVLADKLEEIT
ncbi:hypothetical protein P3T36_000945 [Kitasatospora sp. MAP12-15]|uniref:Scr1 family TA system antitoxin-like transcriptional regulator n=1 Tax=unclassified Kitasatospora TaxID=2633591 RepID=UPI002474A847|nr:Scr1 family TA system antitoxin-like transcriptional regulator [Kitasatospora sp. MAP12-44]MDH6114545.1 hypothetical protein [Kitasatospora sp. MAP12-44]